ncbi:hypothetical protein ACEPPN_016214 [Leptodophora sp. 'Broadleaf-Isolate-01']
MPIKDYGVWIAYPISYVAEKDKSTPHLQLFFDEVPTATKGRFRAAINIKSSTVEESRLVYWFVRNLNNHPITGNLDSFEPGWHPLSSDGLPSLDYIRGNLMDLKDGTLLRHNVPGENNDIIDFISPVLDQAIARKAVIYLFGEQFPNGIHDVHMSITISTRDGAALLHSIAKSLQDNNIHMQYVIFTTYDERRDGQTRIDRNLKNRFSAEVQELYAKTWGNLDPTATVLCKRTIEGALNRARGIGDQNNGMQALVTGSLHLVSGALCLLESDYSIQSLC